MFTILEKTLVQNSCLSRPVVYVDQEVDQNLNSRLADIITKHQGSLTEDRTQASHHIYPVQLSQTKVNIGSGCALLCGRTTMCWCTGAGTLRGNTHTH
ncbi:unnamed protein product [Oncorhynchus mykiss]|uniref:Chromo domain-containing protein n=1 Tax=Oncorhynchus mykiss TaxID=8022 RepID=A0A060Z6N6_ONCMY|nr:unnamed protein product [Oncorhynchus mykiss]